MSQTIDINVRHVTRVEGHGNIVVQARDGKILRNEWQVPEAPRFFEAMVRGCHYEDIQTVVSRICGICSVTHSLAATKAIEDALGLEVSRQTDRLRILLHYAEQLESHSLHVGYLVAPDLLGQKSVVPLVAYLPEVVKTVIAIHRVANEWMERLAGRKTHPVTIKPGGFTRLPSAAELREIQHKLIETRPRLAGLADFVLSVAHKLPAFERETEYVALTHPGTYPFYHGRIGTTDTEATVDIHEFESVVNEHVVAQSTAKWCRWHREAYAVGALARFKLNGERLLPEAQATARQLGLDRDCCNPYMNTVAQVVECVQVVERSLQIIDELLVAGIEPETPRSAPRAGEGVGCLEAPRGILFHRYAFDADGRCERANMVIPTNQNHANIQQDFEALLPAIMDRSQDDIRLAMEMLVRSYDPCISCSTHYLDVQFV